MTVDVRTRVDGPAPAIDPSTFFGSDLPEAFASQADLLAPAIRDRPPRPLTIEVDGERWTLTTSDDGRAHSSAGGADDDRSVVLTAEQVTDLVADQVTPMGWFTSGQLHLRGARLEGVLDWWLLLRGALDERAPHAPGAVDLVDAAGAPLDLNRSFAAADDPAAMADFLARAGFLRIRGLFTDDEMAAVSADMDAVAPDYAPGDGRSWWATLDDGSDALVRMQYFHERSPATAELVADPRLTGLSGLTGDGHLQARMSGNLVEGLFKPIGVAKGISDVPWHKDCSLGRHSYECCSLTVGISVTGAGPESGQLSVVAGSHHALMWPAPSMQPGLDLPVVDLPTDTGDVTIHLSCTMHMAHPPVERPRRVLYTGFSLPPADPEATAAARRRIGAVREAAPVTVSQPSPSTAAGGVAPERSLTQRN